MYHYYTQEELNRLERINYDAYIRESIRDYEQKRLERIEEKENARAWGNDFGW